MLAIFKCFAAATAATSVLSLAACAVDADGQAAPPTRSDMPQEPFAPVDVHELRAAFEEVAGPCQSWELRREAQFAVEAASCGPAVVLSIHTNLEQASKQADVVSDLLVEALERDSVFLVGETWSINCSEELRLCEQLRAALGGTLRHYTR